MDMEVNSKDTLLRILENEEVVRRGRWIEGVHEDEIKELEDDNGNVKRFEDEYEWRFVECE